MTNSIVDTMHLLALGAGEVNPTDADIPDAPYLDRWLIDAYRVTGYVTGHPVLPDGPVSTSRPMHADLNRHWLRTRNTLYRLGNHAGARS